MSTEKWYVDEVISRSYLVKDDYELECSDYYEEWPDDLCGVYDSLDGALNRIADHYGLEYNKRAVHGIYNDEDTDSDFDLLISMGYNVKDEDRNDRYLAISVYVSKVKVEKPSVSAIEDALGLNPLDYYCGAVK